MNNIINILVNPQLQQVVVDQDPGMTLANYVFI
jgi:hypothetical protein